MLHDGVKGGLFVYVPSKVTIPMDVPNFEILPGDQIISSFYQEELKEVPKSVAI